MSKDMYSALLKNEKYKEKCTQYALNELGTRISYLIYNAKSKPIMEKLEDLKMLHQILKPLVGPIKDLLDIDKTIEKLIECINIDIEQGNSVST